MMNDHGQTDGTTRVEPLGPPPSSSLLARVIHTLAEGRDDVEVRSMSSRAATLRIGGKTTLRLVVWDETRRDEITSLLQHLMKRHAEGPLVVGLVGGPRSVRKVLKKAKPMLTMGRTGLLHVGDDAGCWIKDARAVKKRLPKGGRIPPLSDDAWQRLLAERSGEMVDFERRSQEDAKEAGAFARVLGSRRPVVTWSLVALILAVFGLEHLFGGTQSAPVLLRMGALEPERVAQGEIWRLFSATFLHSGVGHLFFNTLVLWILGSSLERVLGSWRFLLLYGASCLGGSLASLAFLEGFSVGASGGLWGLLVAEAVLAWSPRGLLPRAAIPQAKRATMFNLGINLLNSFRPHVDMWAHFGGGAIGAVLMLSTVLTRGLPRLGERETEERTDGADPSIIQTGLPIKAAAGVLAVCLLAGLTLGLANGRPWQLHQVPELQRVPLYGLGISLDLPAGYDVTPSAPDDPAGVTVGDLLTDPGAVVVAFFPADLSEESVAAIEHAALLEALRDSPTEAEVVSGPDDVTLAGRRGAAIVYRYANGVEEEIAIALSDDGFIRVQSVCWPELVDVVPRGHALQVLDSMEPLP